MIMVHNTFVLLLTQLPIGHKGKNCNFLSDMGYSSFWQWQHARIKGTFMQSIFLCVLKYKEHNHDEITVTAADAVVEGHFLVLPYTLKKKPNKEENGSISSC